ncbi:MAG: hypothetical protein ABI361_04985 [Nitrososphaera sp.]
MSEIDRTKKVYLIVHGQRQLIEPIKQSLSAKFSKENMEMASLERAGSPGEYVAMIWPPMAPKEIVVSQITDEKGTGQGMGAWGAVKQKELFRLPLGQ